MSRNCQLGLHDDNGAGQWWRVSEGNPYMPPRTGSAGVYLSSTGAMYLFGGIVPLFFILRSSIPSLNAQILHSGTRFIES